MMSASLYAARIATTRKSVGIRAAFYPSLRALPGEGAHHRLAGDIVVAREPPIVSNGWVAVDVHGLRQDGPVEVLRTLHFEVGVRRVDRRRRLQVALLHRNARSAAVHDLQCRRVPV